MRLRTIGMTAAAMTIAAGLGIAGSGTANASTTVDYLLAGHTYTFITWAPGVQDSCLDDSNYTDGKDNLRAFTCNEMTYQKWTVIDYANGWVQLRNQATNRCLDYSNDSNHFGLRTFTCGTDNFTAGWQRWALVNRTTASGGDEDVLKSANTWDPPYGSQCVDVSMEAGTRAYPCNGASQDAGYQGWTVLDVTYG